MVVHFLTLSWLHFLHFYYPSSWAGLFLPVWHFSPQFIDSTSLLTAKPNHQFHTFFVSGSLMKISSKIGPSADPQKVHLKSCSRQEGLPIIWSIPICLSRGSFAPDSFLAIPSHSVLVKILHVAHYLKCFLKSKEMRARALPVCGI